MTPQSSAVSHYLPKNWIHSLQIMNSSRIMLIALNFWKIWHLGSLSCWLWCLHFPSKEDPLPDSFSLGLLGNSDNPGSCFWVFPESGKNSRARNNIVSGSFYFQGLPHLANKGSGMLCVLYRYCGVCVSSVCFTNSGHNNVIEVRLRVLGFWLWLFH